MIPIHSQALRLVQHAGLLLLLLLLLVGCDGGVDAEAGRYAEYLKRLENQLGDLPASDEPVLLPFPTQRELKLEIPRQVIDVAEFARVHACDLGDLVGERNSALGRVAGPVTLLLQDQRWLRLGPACVDQGQGWLAQVLTAKTETLPQRFWNAVMAGDELQLLMSSAKPLGGQELSGLQPADVALRDLLDHHQALGSLTLNASLLNGSLQALTQGQSLGSMRQRWRSLRLNLGRVTRGLNRSAAQVCRNGKPTPKAKIMRQVFDIQYINLLQPAFAKRYGADQATVQAFRLLQQRLDDVAPLAFTRWYQATLDPQNSQGEWERTQAALRGHALAWQKLWAQCGMPLAPLAPGASAEQD